MDNGVEICRDKAASGLLAHTCGSLRQLLGSKFQGVAVLLHSSQDHLLVGAELLEKAFSSPAVNTPSSCKLLLVVSSAFLVRAFDFTG